MLDSASVNLTNGLTSKSIKILIITYLHLVHPFLGIPMQESLTLEHSGELVRNTLKELLNGSRVPNERNGHLKSTRRDITLRSENILRNPFNEVGRVLLLDL